MSLDQLHHDHAKAVLRDDSDADDINSRVVATLGPERAESCVVFAHETRIDVPIPFVFDVDAYTRARLPDGELFVSLRGEAYDRAYALHVQVRLDDARPWILPLGQITKAEAMELWRRGWSDAAGAGLLVDSNEERIALLVALLPAVFAEEVERIARWAAGPVTKRRYPCSDCRLLFTALRAERLLRRHFGRMNDLRHGLGASRLKNAIEAARNDAYGLVTDRPSHRVQYPSKEAEASSIDRLNAVWEAMEEVRQVGWRALGRGPGEMLDRAWCGLDNPAVYLLDLQDMDEAAQVELVSFFDVRHQLPETDFWDSLRRINRLPNARFLELSANDLLTRELQLIQLDTLPHLRTVALGHNQLSELPDWLGAHASVEVVDLSNNTFEHVPDITGMSRLTWLDLRGNPLPKRARESLMEQRPNLRNLLLD